MEENNNENVDQNVQPTNEIQPEVKEEPVVSTEENQITQPEVKEGEPVVQKETNKKNKTLLIILIGLIIVIAIVVIVVLLLQPSKKDSNKADDNTNTIETNNDIKSSYRMSGNSIEEFDLYFLKLENEAKNRIYSPLSIKYALEMLAEGSSGNSKAQLDAVIGDYKAKKYQNNANMSFANALFVRDTYDSNVTQEFKNILLEKYGAEVVTDSFSSTDTINKWISDKTLNLIDKAVDNVSDKDFVLVNALGIDMNWNYLIHCSSGSSKNVPCYGDGGYSVVYNHEKIEGENDEYSRTSYPYCLEDEFYHLTFNGKEKTKSSTILASFNRYDAITTLGEENIRKTVGDAYDEWLNSEEAKMYDSLLPKDKLLDNYIKELGANFGKTEISTDFLLYTDENVKTFAKDLQTSNGTTLQYVGIMPINDNLSTYIEKVKASDINNIVSNLKELKIENFQEGYATLIEGEIPLFKYEDELNLMEDLIKLGIKDVFDSENADLSTMLTESKGSFISDATHKANIEFSNEGIKAAAVSTEGGMGNTGGGFNYLYEVPTIRIDLTFNNPYMYLIRDKESGEVWFVGTVYEPITK